MAQVITFFNRQAIMGSGASHTLYSEVFEVTSGAEFVAQLRVFMANDELASATGVIEQCFDARLTPTNVWTTLGTSMSALAETNSYQKLSNFGRFLRAKLIAPAAASFVISFDGILRSKV